MVELSRRTFLGGLLSVLAASTFEVSPLRTSNLPMLYGDGKHDDTAGLRALFRKEPLVFATDKVGLDSHEGVIFHSGRFKITSTIELPSDLICKVESAQFDLNELDPGLFAMRGPMESIKPFTGLFTTWVTKGQRALYAEVTSERYDIGDDRELQLLEYCRTRSA